MPIPKAPSGRNLQRPRKILLSHLFGVPTCSVGVDIFSFDVGALQFPGRIELAQAELARVIYRTLACELLPIEIVVLPLKPSLTRTSAIAPPFRAPSLIGCEIRHLYKRRHRGRDLL